MAYVLRDYQDETIGRLQAGTDDFMVEQPTGSGKTLEIVGAAALLVSFKGRRVVIATPQQHVEQAFVDRPYSSLRRPAGGDIVCPDHKFVAARDGDDGSVEEIKQYLTGDRRTHALVCTHAALGRVDPLAALPDDLSDAVLIVDEAHHVPAVRLSQVATRWRRAGGRVLLFTATAFRADGDPVLLDDHPVTGRPMQVIRLTLAQLMEDGQAPPAVESEVIAVRADNVSAEQFAGDEITPEEVQDRLIAQMLDHWVGHGKPKTVVRVPGLRGGSGPMVERVVAAFKKAGASVLDVSGNTPADKARFLAHLPAERAVKTYFDSAYDVLVGVQRVTEGLDWPLCSTVYVCGLPRSLVVVTQLLGRATRKKSVPGYPPEHAARSKIVFFVPCGEPSESLMAHHRRSTVLVIAHLTNSTSAAEWAVIKDIGRGVLRPLGDRTAATCNAAASGAYPKVDPLYRTEALATFAAVRSQLLASGSAAPDVDVLEMAYARRPEMPRAVLRQVMVEYILTATGQDATSTRAAGRVRDRLLADINAAVAVGTPLKTAIREAFEEVVLDLEAYAVVQGTELADLQTQLIAVTGANMLEIGGRLAGARPLTTDWLAKVVGRFKAEHGAYPNEHTKKPVPGWPEESWAGIDQAIGGRLRGWDRLGPAGVRTLREFVNQYARRGPMSALLERFRKETRLNEAESALLDCLISQRVAVSRDEVMAFGETAVPSSFGTAWRPKWWVLREWWRTHFGGQECDLPPLADAYAVVLLVNLAKWMKAVGKGDVGLADWGDEAAAHVGGRYYGAAFAAVPDATYEAAKTVLHRGKGFGGVFVESLLTDPGAGAKRRDGVKPFSRTDAGYAPAVGAGRLFVTAAGAAVGKGAADAKTTPVAVPFEWVTTVGERGVPVDWKAALVGMPGVVLSDRTKKAVAV